MKQTTNKQQRLVAPQVLSAMLGVSAPDLRRDARAGRLPCVRVGEKGILFDLDSVSDVLLRRARTSKDENARKGGAR